MRNSILITIFSLLFISNACSQTTSKTSTSSSTSYSISIDTDDDTEYGNTSVSIKRTDAILKLNASFNKERTNKVRDFLLNRLQKDYMKVTGSTHLWTKNSNGEEVFECKLTRGSVRLFVDKEAVSNSFYTKIDKLSTDLKDFISGSDSEKEAQKDSERAQKDMERAKEDLKRAQKDLERAKRDLERAKEKTK